MRDEGTRAVQPKWRGLTALLVFCSAAILGSSALAVPETESPFRNLQIFARVLAHIETSYVTDVDQDVLVHGAIRGMLASLDPHSAYMDPDEYKQLNSSTEGQFAGIGVEISVQDGWLVVLSVFEGGSAAEVGLKPGDRFLAINNRPARDMRIQDAVKLMRGEPGTEVQVHIRREGEEKALVKTLKRKVIKVDPVSGTVLADRIVHAKLRIFSRTTAEDLFAVLTKAQQETKNAGGIAGLILDMRSNPGGLLDQAVLVSDLFLSSGTIVSTRSRDMKLLSESKATKRGTLGNFPIVVLVNGYTASAAEIVAGALRDHNRAIIVGTRTFGKGSVQSVIELPDGSGMKLTIARYYTPSGESIQAKGIQPDMVIEQLSQELLEKASLEDTQVREASLTGHLKSGQDDQEPETTNNDASQIRTEALGKDAAPFADDFQARGAHQALLALIRDRQTR